jgi:hypothetical protein
MLLRIKQWYRRRLIAENAGMLQQNMVASREIWTKFVRHGMFEAAAKAGRCTEITMNISQNFNGDAPLSPNDLSLLCDTNKELRRLFEQAGLGTAAKFDRRYGALPRH